MRQLADSVAGTFSGDVLGRLGRGTEETQKKIEDNTRKGKEHLAQIDENLRMNQLFNQA